MTTYPLSEPATIYRPGKDQSADAAPSDIVARGTLSDCAEILEKWSVDDRAAVRIDMDDLGLRYGPDEIEELMQFLAAEHAEAELPVGLVDRP